MVKVHKLIVSASGLIFSYLWPLVLSMLIIKFVHSAGGLQFAAADNLDSNGLIDAFSALVATNGDINHQPIQV